MFILSPPYAGERVRVRGDSGGYTSSMRCSAAIVLILLPINLFAAPNPNLITFNDNGAWCWYQDPRILHDPANNTLLICSVAASEGLNGDSRSGDIDLTTY